MKRVFALALSLIIVFSLVACGEKIDSSSADADTKGDTEIDTNIKAELIGLEKEEEKEKESIFEEVVVVDNEECTIKITGIDPDYIWGYALKAYFENKSADKNYMFYVESAAIDGVESDPIFACEVSAGNKTNKFISFTDEYLQENYIEFTDIQLSFLVYDSDDRVSDEVVKETVHVYPYGANNATTFTREGQESDTVLVDNRYVTVVVTGYDEDVSDYKVNLFLVNKTDTDIMVRAENVSVNGYMLDPVYASSVIPDKCKFSSMSWYISDFEDNGITEVEEIEFELRVYDRNDLNTNAFTNKYVMLSP